MKPQHTAFLFGFVVGLIVTWLYHQRPTST
jgi:hypothetical protein